MSRADAHGLGEREHDEHQVAGEADPGDRLLAEPPDEVEVGKEVERLEDHREGDERRQLHDVAADRALGQVFHGQCGALRSALGIIKRVASE
jgi:hypothetical protein